MAAPNNNLLTRLWGAFRRQRSSSDLGIQQQRSRIGTFQRRSISLSASINPVRPVMGDLQNSRDLIEIADWSYESSHSVGFMARDAFQQIDGRVNSWRVAETLADGTKIHPDVLAIGKEMEQRRDGKDLVLGGDTLQQAAIEALSYGDSFVQLGIYKEGIGKNDWAVCRSRYMPVFSTFVDVDEEDGSIRAYRIQEKMFPSGDDVIIHPLKMLQFKIGKSGAGYYGKPPTFQQIPQWRKVKDCAADIEQASRDTGVAPWLHIMPEGTDESYKEAYRQEYQEMLNEGIVTNLFLMPSADVKKAAANAGALSNLLDYWLQLRYQMVLPGVPLWFFPGLGLKESSGKDIANQPALAYARQIASLRSMIGEQVRWAISVEIVLKKGFDWFQQNGRFDIEWGAWFVTGMEQGIQNQEDQSDNANPAKEDQPDKADEEQQSINGLLYAARNGRH